MNTSIEFIREMDGFTGSACLVKRDSDYFVVSSTIAPFSGPETLVFRADKNGNIEEWIEVAGGKGMTRDEAIKELLRSDT